MTDFPFWHATNASYELKLISIKERRSQEGPVLILRHQMRAMLAAV